MVIMTAAAHLAALIATAGDFPDLGRRTPQLTCHTRILLAAAPATTISTPRRSCCGPRCLTSEDTSRREPATPRPITPFVAGALGYGRFCIESGRPTRPRRGCIKPVPAQARAGDLRPPVRSWEQAAALVGARTPKTQDLVTEAHPVIAEHARAHNMFHEATVFRADPVGIGRLREVTINAGEHAERHWREIGATSLHPPDLAAAQLIALFRGLFDDAIAMVDEARKLGRPAATQLAAVCPARRTSATSGGVMRRGDGVRRAR